MKNKDYIVLTLLSSDDKLTAYHLPTANSFLIMDGTGYLVCSLKKDELKSFLNGETDIKTTYDKIINYSEQDDKYKPSLEELDEYLNLEPDNGE